MVTKHNDEYAFPTYRVAPSHPNIKAIFFDLDGVLVDAADWHKDAFNKTMVRYGASPLSDKEHHEIYNGLSTHKKLEILIAEGRFSKDWSEYSLFTSYFYKLKQQYTIKTIKEKCAPVEQVCDTVNYAYQEGYRLAVVTNCSRYTCKLMLELSDLDGYFEFIIANEDVEGSVKPSPRPYLEARWRMKLKNKEALAIDDTNKGIKSAMGAFCRTWQLEKFEDLSRANLVATLDKYKYPL